MSPVKSALATLAASVFGILLVLLAIADSLDFARWWVFSEEQASTNPACVATAAAAHGIRRLQPDDRGRFWSLPAPVPGLSWHGLSEPFVSISQEGGKVTVTVSSKWPPLWPGEEAAAQAFTASLAKRVAMECRKVDTESRR